MTTTIIAEIGINHNGSLENAVKLVEAAADAGCNTIKLQFFSAKHLYPESAGSLEWRDQNKKYHYDIYQAVQGFETPADWIDPLMKRCEQLQLDFLSSVFDPNGLALLIKHGMKQIKLSSYTITNLPLIDACAQTGLPIIMSTGGACLAETEEAVKTITNYHDQVSLLHCSLEYPTKPQDCNLGVMKTLQYCFPEIQIGYSDHTMEISDAPIQSVFLGGSIVEKHITLDKGMKGPDHFFALDPTELKKMVTDIRQAEKKTRQNSFTIDPMIYGSSAKCCHDNEKYLRNFSYMTLFARQHIKTGKRIHPSDLIILRPGNKKRGLDPKYIDLFKKFPINAPREIRAEEPITWDLIL